MQQKLQYILKQHEAYNTYTAIQEIRTNNCSAKVQLWIDAFNYNVFAFGSSQI